VTTTNNHNQYHNLNPTTVDDDDKRGQAKRYEGARDKYPTAATTTIRGGARDAPGMFLFLIFFFAVPKFFAGNHHTLHCEQDHQDDLQHHFDASKHRNHNHNASKCDHHHHPNTVALGLETRVGFFLPFF